MNIQIMGTNLELTEAIKTHINEKIGGLDKYFDGILEVRVDVGKTTKHHNKGDVFRAEVNVTVPHKVVRSEAVSDDLYKAINEAKEHAKRELVTYKEKMRGV